MAILRYLLPAFAVAGSVLAQNGCSADENIVQNQGDADALSSCSTIDGDLIIAEQTVESISLDGIQRIRGSLKCESASNLTEIRAGQLSSIEGEFRLDGLTRLSSLVFPGLETVRDIRWRALPALQELSFTREVSRAESVIITNTNLASLDGINLQTVNQLNINNNLYLERIELELANITEALNIQANSRRLRVSFPNLEWAFNMTFRNCSSVEVPELTYVNGSMGFINNFFESFSAPQLTELGRDGSLSFVDNEDLTNVTFPNLQTIGGGLLVQNNTNLETIDGFQALEVVGGAIDMSGNFTEVELPALRDVRGGFNMQTAAVFDCDPFNNAKREGVIKGRYTCRGEQERPGNAQTTPTSSSSGSGASETGAAGKHAVNAGAVVGLSAFVAALSVVAL